MMENTGSFPSPRTAESFPAGLRVLVVDDDPTWLKILEKMLKKCSYEVTTCCLARDALGLLRERKDRFDIVISDVNMPDMDGFKLLEHVGLEMDLPVIMMSVDGETSRVMKGVKHGACDYLLKPVRLKELRNIWQHVLRKRIHDVKDTENHDHCCIEGAYMMKSGSNEYDDELLLNGGDPSCAKKRKDIRNEELSDCDFNNPGAAKKSRVAWTVDLHQKFVDAVNQIGFDKVGPKKILDLMNVPWLTRENVASHLQKYRLYLSRLQKQSEPNNSVNGNKHSDFSPKDTPEKFGIQCSTSARQHNSANCFGYSCDKSLSQGAVPEISGENLKNIVSFMPVTEEKNTSAADVPLAQLVNNDPQMGVVLSFGSMVPDLACKSLGSATSQRHSWNGEISAMQLMHHPKHDHEHLPLEEGYSELPLPTQLHHFQIDHQRSPTSANVRIYTNNGDKTSPYKVKPLHANCKSDYIRNATPEHPSDSLSNQLDCDVGKPQGFRQLPVISAFSSTKVHDLDQSCINGRDSPWNLTLKNAPCWASSPEKLQLCSFQGYGCFQDVELNLDCFEHAYSPTSIAELQGYVYEELIYNSDYQFEQMEYPRGEGLFIA